MEAEKTLWITHGQVHLPSIRFGPFSSMPGKLTWGETRGGWHEGTPQTPAVQYSRTHRRVVSVTNNSIKLQIFSRYRYQPPGNHILCRFEFSGYNNYVFRLTLEIR